MNQSMFSIVYTKSFEVKPNSIITLTPNLTESFSTLWFFFWDTLVFKHRTWQIVWNLFNFYHGLHVWYHEISTNLMIFKLRLLFLEFKNHLATRSWSCSWTRCPKFLFIPGVKPHTRLNNMNIIFLLILFYYLNHLQFKFDLYQNIP